MRPYAELIKRWADDPTMEIEYLSSHDKWEPVKAPTWHPSLLYREKPKEKKKVEMWQWAVGNKALAGRIMATEFYTSESAMQSAYHSDQWDFLSRIEGSKIEVEE